MVAAAVGLALLAGCASPAPAIPPTARPTQEVDEAMRGEAAAPTEERAAAIALCVLELGRRLNLPEGSIEVLGAEAVEWPDTSLGCPQPGMMYAQVITPGYRVRLRAAGETYEYHTDGQRAITCP